MDGEFYLPDRKAELAACERRLHQEMQDRERDLNVVRANLPAGASLKQTPAYFSMLVAHRRWQFAYEKLLKLKRGGVPCVVRSSP